MEEQTKEAYFRGFCKVAQKNGRDPGELARLALGFKRMKKAESKVFVRDLVKKAYGPVMPLIIPRAPAAQSAKPVQPAVRPAARPAVQSQAAQKPSKNPVQPAAPQNKPSDVGLAFQKRFGNLMNVNAASQKFKGWKYDSTNDSWTSPKGVSYSSDQIARRIGARQSAMTRPSYRKPPAPAQSSNQTFPTSPTGLMPNGVPPPSVTRQTNGRGAPVKPIAPPPAKKNQPNELLFHYPDVSQDTYNQFNQTARNLGYTYQGKGSWKDSSGRSITPDQTESKVLRPIADRLASQDILRASREADEEYNREYAPLFGRRYDRKTNTYQPIPSTHKPMSRRDQIRRIDKILGNGSKGRRYY